MGGAVLLGMAEKEGEGVDDVLAVTAAVLLPGGPAVPLPGAEAVAVPYALSLGEGELLPVPLAHSDSVPTADVAMGVGVRECSALAVSCARPQEAVGAGREGVGESEPLAAPLALFSEVALGKGDSVAAKRGEGVSPCAGLAVFAALEAVTLAVLLALGAAETLAEPLPAPLTLGEAEGVPAAEVGTGLSVAEEQGEGVALLDTLPVCEARGVVLASELPLALPVGVAPPEADAPREAEAELQEVGKGDALGESVKVLMPEVAMGVEVRLPPGGPLGVGDTEPLPLALRLGECVAEWDGKAVEEDESVGAKGVAEKALEGEPGGAEGERVTLGEGVALGGALVARAERVKLGLGEMVSEEVPLVEKEGEAVEVGVVHWEGEGESVGGGEPVALEVAVAPSAREAEGAGVALVEAEGLAARGGEAVSRGDCEAVSEAVEVGECMGDGEAVRGEDAVELGVGDGEERALGEAEGEGVLERDEQGEGEVEAVAQGKGVGEMELDCEGDALGE